LHPIEVKDEEELHKNREEDAARPYYVSAHHAPQVEPQDDEKNIRYKQEKVVLAAPLAPHIINCDRPYFVLGPVHYSPC
jgi:hypothetical protein